MSLFDRLPLIERPARSPRDTVTATDPAPPPSVMQNGPYHTLVLRGITNPFAEGMAVSLWMPPGLLGRRDRIHADGRGDYRLKQFLETHTQSQMVFPESGGDIKETHQVYAHVVVRIPRELFERDLYDADGDNSGRLIVGLRHLHNRDFGRNLYGASQPRYVVAPHDGPADMVMVIVGRGLHLPAEGDRPTHTVSLRFRDATGAERDLPGPTVPLHRPALHRVEDVPLGVYAGGQRYLMFAADLPWSGFPFSHGRGRAVIDLERGEGRGDGQWITRTAETTSDPATGERQWRFVSLEAGDEPGAEPEILTVTLRRLAAEPVRPVLRLLPEEDDHSDEPEDEEKDEEDDATLVVTTSRDPASLSLTVAGILLPRIDGGRAPQGLRSYRLGFDAEGNLAEHGTPAVAELGASSGKPGVFYRLCGKAGGAWRAVALEPIRLDGGARPARVPPPPAVAGHFQAMVLLSDPPVLALAAGAAHVLGRVGGVPAVPGAAKITLGLLDEASTLGWDGPGETTLEAANLSRNHLLLRAEAEELRLRLLHGRTAVMVLDADGDQRAVLRPGGQDEVTAHAGELVVLGCYVLRVGEGD